MASIQLVIHVCVYAGEMSRAGSDALIPVAYGLELVMGLWKLYELSIGRLGTGVWEAATTLLAIMSPFPVMFALFMGALAVALTVAMVIALVEHALKRAKPCDVLGICLSMSSLVVGLYFLLALGKTLVHTAWTLV